jgi:hypothetical protein
VYKREVNNYLALGRQFSPPHHFSGGLKLNKLCCVEDWENIEMKDMLNHLGYSGFIHRKDWEWSLGLIAMQRFNMLNNNSIVLGVGATDLYMMNGWDEAAPADFIRNPQKYSEQEYNHQKLSVLNLDGRKLSLDSNHFDVVFSFSSIEHFGGRKHSGALESV